MLERVARGQLPAEQFWNSKAMFADWDEVLSGKDSAVENYLTFASLGRSLDALDSFDVAGVNMRNRDAIKHSGYWRIWLINWML